MRFFEWDYDANLVTEYERKGECNRCGQCCTTSIYLTIAFDKAKEGDRTVRDGGTGTNEKGIWSEIEDGDISRYYSIVSIEEIGQHGCEALERHNGCMQCTDHLKKANICKDWPLSPKCVEPFPDCGYSFEAMEQWSIDEMEYCDE